MKKILAALLFLASCEKHDNTNTLRIVTSADYPPFSFYYNGKITGLEIDLANIIAQKMQKEVQFDDMSFDGLLGALTTSRADMAISSITPTPEREKKVNFSSEYFRTEFAFVVLDNGKISKISDVANKTIGVQANSIFETYATKEFNAVYPVKVSTLAKVPDLIQDLKIGRSVAVLMGYTEAVNFAKNIPHLKVILLADDSKVPTPTEVFAIALPKDSKYLDTINGILMQLKLDGTLARLEMQWVKQMKQQTTLDKVAPN